MNKREHTRAYNLFASSHKGNTAQRENNTCCAFSCDLPAKIRTAILTLVIAAMAVVASPIVMGDGEAHAYISEDKTTAVVADFDELKKAVEGSDGYANVTDIIVDPQAAVDFVDASDENTEVSYGDGAFYIPIEQPIRVSRDVRITAAEGVQVVFARSAKGGNGDYDSKAFAGANEDWPAFFNVINSRGKLTIEGDIVMSGEQVSADFDEADASFSFDAEAKEWSRGNGTGIVDGGYFLHSVSGGDIVVEEGVQITGLTTDSTVKNASPVYLGGGSTYTMNGGAIVENDFGVTAKDVADATTAGAITLEDSKTTATLNEGEIGGNVADVAGVYVKEGAQLSVGKKFSIDANEIYTVESAKATEEITIAPKKSLKSAKAPAMQTRGAGDSVVTSTAALKTALSNGISPIILDTNLTKDGKNYFAVDEPLTVSKAVEITTKDGKEIIIARSTNFEPKNDKPAIFNVVSGGDLTLNQKVTMSGVEIEKPKYVKLKLSAGENMYFGKVEEGLGYGKLPYFRPVSGADSAMELTVKSTGHLSYNSTDTIAYNFVIHTENNPGNQDFRVSTFDDKNQLIPGYVSSLEEGKTYVASVVVNGVTEYIDSSGKDRTSNLDNALRFTAEAVSGEGEKALKVNNKTGDDAWTKEEVLPGGYFIHATGGGKVTINNNVTLKNLVTDTSVKNVAPVVVVGTGNEPSADQKGVDADKNFVMNGGSIEGNIIGYIGDEMDSTKPVKEIAGAIKGEDETGKGNMTNTAGGVVFTDGATGKITGGTINGNKADAGGIIVTERAHVIFSGGGINSNIGVHHAGAAQVEHGGTLVMMGDAEMKNNIAWYKGGAVWATEWGTSGYAVADWSRWPSSFPELIPGRSTPSEYGGGNFVMDGGTISNNTAFARAGAVEVESDGVQLNKGLISGNNCRSLGGAIYIEGDSPDYSYTLVIPEGYITENTAVFQNTNGTYREQYENKLNRKIGSSMDDNGSWLVDSNVVSSDGDFNGAMGNGGGIWLCPVGGTSVFTDENNDIYIWNNDAQRNKGGEDFYLHRGNGAAILQHLNGTWKNEVTGNTETGVVSGPLSLKNTPEPPFTKGSSSDTLVIENNIARDGGAIACNGTFIIGKTVDVHRYNSRLNLNKVWDEGTEPSGKNVNLKLQYKYKGQKYDLKYMDAGEQKTYVVDLDGAADGTEIEATFGEIAPSTTDGKITWNAAAFIPQYVEHNGEKVFLYTLENPAKKNYAGENTGTNGNDIDFSALDEIDLSNELHVAHLYKYVAEVQNGNENIPAPINIKNWNLTIEERVTVKADGTVVNYDAKEYLPQGGTVMASAQHVDLKDPITGETIQGGSFSITFSTATFNETIVNKIESSEVTLTKKDNNGQTLTGAEFVLVEAVNGGGTGNNLNYRFPGDENKWEAASHDGTYLDIAVKGVAADDKIVSGPNGTVTIDGLEAGQDYFLFETKAPTGSFEAHTAPWLIHVTSNGEATVRAIKKDFRDKVEYNPGTKRTELYNDKKVWHRYWNDSWFETAATTELINERTPIELTKIGEGNYANGLPGVSFKLYKASVSVPNDNHSVQFSTGQNVTSGPGGTIVLPTTANGTYLLFESAVPSQYKRQVDPWRVVINNGEAKVYTLTGGRDSMGRAAGTATGWHWKTGSGETRTTLPDGEYTADYFDKKVWPGFYFSSTPLAGNKLSNEKISINLTKVRQNGTSLGDAISAQATFALYEADKTPSQVSSDGNSFITNVDIGKKSNGTSQTGLTTNDGTLNITNIEAEKLYLLFETTAPEGYAKSKAPWLLYVKSDGKYRLFKHNSTNKDATSWSTGDGTYFSELVEDNAGKLGNSPLDFSFTKGDRANSNINIIDATFVLYHAKITPGTPNVYNIDTSKGNNNGRVDGTITCENGKYNLPITPPTSGNAYYMLFETTAHEGYVLPRTPWGIAVNEYGDVKAYKMIDEYADAFEAEYTEDFGDKSITELSKAQLETISINCDTINQDTNGKLLNEKKPIQITKVKGLVTNNSVTLAQKEKLAGVKFQLYKAKNVGGYWERRAPIGGELTSDENGVITLPQQVMRENSVDDVDYWLEEIDTVSGYQLSSRPWILNIHQTNRTLDHVYWPKNDVVTSNGVTKVKSGTPNVEDMGSYVFNEPEKTTRKARKVWDGGKAPSNVTSIDFELYSDISGTSAVIQTKTLTNWNSEVVFNDLPTYTSDGDGGLREIQYRIVEKPVEGYVPSYEVDSATGVTTVTNKKLTGGKVNLTIDKNWIDTSDSLKEEVTVEIWSDKTGEKAFLDYAKLSADTNWTITVRDLPLYREDDSTKKVKYWVKEVGLDNFTQMDTTLDDGTIEATNGASNTQNTSVYTAYAKPNSSVDISQGIAYLEYFIETPDGETEQVFCLNKKSAYPTIRSENGKEGKKYIRTEVAKENLAGFISNPEYAKVQDSPTLYYKLLKAIYLGLGGDGADLLSSDAVNDDKHLLAYMTQFAIYEYTDFYYKGNGYDFTDKGRANPVDYYGPFGLSYYPTQSQGYDIYGTLRTLKWRVPSTLTTPYKTLMQGIEGAKNSTIDSLGLKFYIYKPVKDDGKTIDNTRQYLIGVDSAAVNKYVHLNNKYSPSKITLYKHSSKETSDKPMPLSGVSFDLYEKDPAEHMDDETWLNANKVNTSALTTNGDGNVEINNLLFGKTYYLVERQARDDYVRLSKPISFTLSKTDGNNTQAWTPETENTLVLKAGGSITTTLKVANEPIYELPKTGGIGTYWFMVIGAMMMAFAATMVFTRRRRMLT